MGDNTEKRVDVNAAWDGLSADQQKAIGLAAIILGMGGWGADNGFDPRQGFVAAEAEAGRALHAALIDAGMIDPDGGSAQLPDVSVLDVRACRVCGCTDAWSCATAGHDPCSWVEADLCSTCAGAGATASRSVASAGEDRRRLVEALVRDHGMSVLNAAQMAEDGQVDVCIMGDDSVMLAASYAELGAIEQDALELPGMAGGVDSRSRWTVDKCLQAGVDLDELAAELASKAVPEAAAGVAV